MTLRRSCLAVPGSNARMMEKAAASGSDLVFFDLEDGCAPAEKANARALVVEALRTLDFGRSLRAFRINDVTTPWCYRDVVEVVTAVGDRLDAVIVPKVEDPSHVHFVAHLLAGLERDLGWKRIALELQIESPLGAANLAEICRASTRIESVIFGPGDYAAGLGLPGLDIGVADERYEGQQWSWVMSSIAVHARAFGAQPIDGPYADYRDEEGFRRSALQAKLLGFAGKWCIHPIQIPWANEVFSPTRVEAEAALGIIAAYEAAATDGRGAIAIDGKLVDEASRKLAEATVALARAAGVL